MKDRPTKLVRLLLPEAFQTEESARVHPAREAKRLGKVPPSEPMLAIARHARRSLDELGRLAVARGRAGSRSGTWIGRLFSIVRDLTTDLVMSSEKSYRGTILGLHHGLGVFNLLEDAAIVSGDQELADFCARLIAERAKLVADAERELAWFAQNPELALTRGSFGPRLKTA